MHLKWLLKKYLKLKLRKCLHLKFLQLKKKLKGKERKQLRKETRKNNVRPHRMAIQLIIGLRNPGAAYEQTRHNAGGWFAISLAKQYQAPFKLDKKMQSEIADLKVDEHSCKLALPLTFMNHSGQPTRAISQFYRILPEELLVVHDELDLPVG